MQVGNDIVDLRDPSNQPDVIHPRFDARVFTRAERSALRECGSAHRHRWALWAAKESTYKAAKKLDSTLRFFPQQFVVDGLDEDRAEVHHGTGRFLVHLSQCDDWVHAVATPYTRPDRKLSGISRPPSLNPGLTCRVPGSAEVRSLEGALDDASEVVRDLARDSIASGMAVAPEELELDASGRIPEVRMRDASLQVDLSMSHDGRYVACAWAGTRHP